MTESRDIYDILKYLMERVDEIADATGSLTQIMNVSDIAKMYGKSRTSMYAQHRYLLPNFGIAEDGHSTVTEWTRREVLAWNSKPLQDRKNELKARIFPVNKKG